MLSESSDRYVIRVKMDQDQSDKDATTECPTQHVEVTVAEFLRFVRALDKPAEDIPAVRRYARERRPF
jgi:hypothetical protein